MAEGRENGRRGGKEGAAWPEGQVAWEGDDGQTREEGEGRGEKGSQKGKTSRSGRERTKSQEAPERMTKEKLGTGENRC